MRAGSIETVQSSFELCQADSIRYRLPQRDPGVRAHMAQPDAVQSLTAATCGGDEVGHAFEAAFDRVLLCQSHRIDDVDGDNLDHTNGSAEVRTGFHPGQVPFPVDRPDAAGLYPRQDIVPEQHGAGG